MDVWSLLTAGSATGGVGGTVAEALPGSSAINLLVPSGMHRLGMRAQNREPSSLQISSAARMTGFMPSGYGETMRVRRDDQAATSGR